MSHAGLVVAMFWGAVVGAPEPGPGERSVIDAVEGVAWYRESVDDAWKRAKAGVELPGSAQIRANPAAVVVLRADDGRRVEVSGAGTKLAGEAFRPPAVKQEQKNSRACAIEKVAGMAQYRARRDESWKKAVEGVELPVEGELRVGPRTEVVLRVGEAKRVVDRLGTIKISDAIAEPSGKLPYGRTRFEVEAEGVEHESVLISPPVVLRRGCRLAVVDKEEQWAGRLWREAKEGVENWGRRTSP